MSLFTRFRRLPAQGRTTAEEATAEEVPTAGGRRRARLVVAWVTTGLAALLVLFALVAPNELGRLTPGAFVRLPLEGLLGAVLVLILPERARRVVAPLAGLALGLLLIWKIIDMGFFAVLAQPFDPVRDWPLLEAAAGFLGESIGRAGVIGAVVAAAVVAVLVLVLMTMAVLRLTRLMVRHRATAARTVAVLGVVWVVCALLGAQIVPGVPVPAVNYDRLVRVYASLQDERVFAAEAAVDAFHDTPGERLLTALRGKDVMVVFVESYGREAVEDPEFAAQVDAVLDAGTRRLDAAGFASRSAFLTSPTVGGGSWLAHATLLSGLWIDNQRRYHTLVSSDRLTLNGAFHRAGWRTVAGMPAITRAWPEGAFFGYDRIYDANDLGYRGPRVSWGTTPDQYTLSALERFERASADRAPVMAEIALISSHGPWPGVPPLVNWNRIGDGSVFETVPPAADPSDLAGRDLTQLRTGYRRAIAYSLDTLVSYVETYGDEDLVLVFLGDHQPAPIVTGEGASRDVPITIIAGDPTVLDRISGWGWQDGLKPGPQAPVWRMDAFRDRFLTAFGP